jgi:hypothetical protein
MYSAVSEQMDKGQGEARKGSKQKKKRGSLRLDFISSAEGSSEGSARLALLAFLSFFFEEDDAESFFSAADLESDFLSAAFLSSLVSSFFSTGLDVEVAVGWGASERGKEGAKRCG